MAGSRTEKIGTVFSRVQGLIRAGALKDVDRPIWYDVYAAFPPRIEPKYDRYIQEQQPINIFYREDAIRAKFYNTFGSPDIIDMKQTHCNCYSERFIKKYIELESQTSGQSESQLFEAVTESLKSEGIVLKTLADIDKEKKAQKKAKEAFLKESRQEESQNIVTQRIQQLSENQEPVDFIHEEILDPELKKD